VRAAFGVPGESFLPVLGRLHDLKDKLNSSSAARKAARPTWRTPGQAPGEPGVLFVTRGPGRHQRRGRRAYRLPGFDAAVMFVGQVGNDFVEREAFQEWTTGACTGRSPSGWRRSIASSAFPNT
jgi:acetolactate synthase-1/2/3 large subunit